MNTHENRYILIRESISTRVPEHLSAGHLSLDPDLLHKSRILDRVPWTDIIYHSDAICRKSAGSQRMAPSNKVIYYHRVTPPTLSATSLL